jgi:hypothetical protein
MFFNEPQGRAGIFVNTACHCVKLRGVVVVLLQNTSMEKVASPTCCESKHSIASIASIASIPSITPQSNDQTVD